MKRLASYLACALGSAILGCGAGFDSASGQDALRGGAVAISSDQYVDERVSADEGDNTDWLVVNLEQPGSITLEVWWDNPDVEGNLLLRSRASASVQQREHKSGVRHEKLGPIELDAGQVFVRIQATSGTSGYSMRLVTGAAAGQGLPQF